ncbi:MAG: hypothetical protein V9G12_18150 [Microthrixaceae bacterium]
MPSTRLTVRLAAALVGALIAVAVFVVMPDEKAAQARVDRGGPVRPGAPVGALAPHRPPRSPRPRCGRGEQELVADAEVAQRFPDRVVHETATTSSRRRSTAARSGAASPARRPRSVSTGSTQPTAEARLTGSELAEFRSLTGGIELRPTG